MGRKSHKGRTAGNKSTEKRPTRTRESREDQTLCQNGKETEVDNTVKLTNLTETESVDMDDVEKSVLPKYLCWVIFAWTLISRLWYVTTPTNWWILHPDEIYQTIEVAHTEAFGYGFRPYEYLPPPGNITFSAEHARTNEMGMYSLRSFLLVKVISMVMLFADRCGVTSSPFLVIKMFHAIFTSSLPLAVHRFSKALYKSHDIATLATMLTSLSLSLNVLGTHTLINSFISPFVFFSLVPLVDVINCIRKEPRPHCVTYMPQNSKDTSRKHAEESSEHCVQEFSKEHRTASFNEKDKLENGTANENIYINGHVVTHGGHGEHTQTHVDELDNERSSSWYGLLDAAFQLLSPSKAFRHVNIKLNVCNGGDIGDINSNIVKKDNKDRPSHALYKQCVTKIPTANEPRHPVKNIIKQYMKINDVLLGLLMGLSIYTRTDIILIPAVMCVLFISDIMRNLYTVICGIIEYAFGVAFGLAIGGYLDSVTYGVWFISLKQWFKFNIWNGFSSAIFGKSSCWFYVDQLLNLEPLAAIGCSILLLDIVITYVFQVSCKSNLPESRKYSLHKNVSFSFFITLFIYSSIGHKELRFFHNGLVLLYISLARSIYNLCRYYCLFTKNQTQYQYYSRVIYVLVTLLFSSHIYCFYQMDNEAISKLSYEGTVDADVNICMDYIRRQTDVNGVFMDRSLFQFGGYSVLHKDVPLFVFHTYVYMEYDLKIRMKDSRFFSHNISTGVSTFIRMSDFVSGDNIAYLTKLLIEKPQYNYILLGSTRRFIQMGYTEVFRLKNAKVLKRSFLEEVEAKLADIAERTPMGNNATLLEYEGHWLRHNGLYKKAEQRLLMANRIDATRVGPFQILLEMFKMFKSERNYKTVLKSCMELHTSKECHKPYAPIKLH